MINRPSLNPNDCAACAIQVLCHYSYWWVYHKLNKAAGEHEKKGFYYPTLVKEFDLFGENYAEWDFRPVKLSEVRLNEPAIIGITLENNKSHYVVVEDDTVACNSIDAKFGVRIDKYKYRDAVVNCIIWEPKAWFHSFIYRDGEFHILANQYEIQCRKAGVE